MKDIVYEKYFSNYKYSFIAPEINEENKLKVVLSNLYSFIKQEIEIITFYKNKSRKPFYLDDENHYLLFKVKRLYFLSVDGELELLSKAR